jgi:serine/threonine protein kinase
MFKAPVSLEELSRLNSGLQYGFSQVGKFITVYPKNSEEAVSLAASLHQLTRAFTGPAVPYDRPFQKNSSVYYRYGGFHPLNIKHRNGQSSYAIRDPKGRLIKDNREPGAALPKWLQDPFVDAKPRHLSRAASASPLKRTMLVYEAMSQRGKGGVYRALDVSVTPVRQCVLKEGRRNGETDWDGRDGFWRVKHEAKVLSELLARSIPVPQVYQCFEVDDHYYLAMEFVEGEILQTLLAKKKQKLKLSGVIQYGLALAKLVNKIHRAGWAWRDCKPTNIIVNQSQSLVALDFEGACRLARPDPMPWGTPGYVSYDNQPETDDLYALGSVLHQLVSGRVPTFGRPQGEAIKLGRRVPAALTQVISSLLSPVPDLRPSAYRVSQVLKSL